MRSAKSASDHDIDIDFDTELALLLPDLRRRARHLTASSATAEDLVQDTLERALRFRRSFVPGSNLRAWMMRILSNTFISTRRRRTIERRVLEQAALDPNGWSSGEPTVQRPALTRSLERELDRLPPRIGVTLRLVDLGDASYRDAADILDVPVGTIMSRLHRGRARLAEALRTEALPGPLEPTALSA
jgi:RNA polymerase sigma-70 factor, ECF subfamily